MPAIMTFLTHAVKGVEHMIRSLMLKLRHYTIHARLLFKDSLFLVKCYLVYRNSFRSLRDLMNTVIKSDYREDFRKRCLIEHYLLSGKLSCKDLYCKLNYMGRELVIKLLREEDVITVQEIFFEEEYALLNVKDKCVIDIGAYIGDSATYFVVSGAKEVIAVEPDDQAFRALCDNIGINGLKNVKPVKMAVVSSCDLEVLIHSCENPTVLKIDCEGCEYGIFSVNISKCGRLFDNVEEVILEYHRYAGNPLKLYDVLRSLGYTVVIKPKSKNLGIIYAKRKVCPVRNQIE